MTNEDQVAKTIVSTNVCYVVILTQIVAFVFQEMHVRNVVSLLVVSVAAIPM